MSAQSPAERTGHKDHPCDVCGGMDAVEAPYVPLYTGGQPLFICETCGFVYVRSRRSAEEIARNWSEELYKGHYETSIPAVKARHVYVADFIDTRIGLEGAKVVDVGAGTGQFMGILRDLYKSRVFGIEPSAENCRILAAKNLDHFHGTIEQYAAKNTGVGEADVVTITWTLENCSSCKDMLGLARAILKPGGHVVVATGSRILVPFKKPLTLYLNKTPADTNSFRFSANTLRLLLHRCGFTVSHVNRYLDTDYLCVVASKEDTDRPAPRGDNHLEVYGFFERWHQDTLHYVTQKPDGM